MVETGHEKRQTGSVFSRHEKDRVTFNDIDRPSRVCKLGGRQGTRRRHSAAGYGLLSVGLGLVYLVSVALRERGEILWWLGEREGEV